MPAAKAKSARSGDTATKSEAAGRSQPRSARPTAAVSAATTSAPPIVPTAPAVNLVVATPCFGGQISVLYAASLFKLKLVRSYSQFTFKVLFKDGDALITRARAEPDRRNFSTTSATHLLFIDADIGFEPEQVIAADRMRRRHVCCDLSDQAHRLGQGEVDDRDGAANPAAAALQYVFEVGDPNAVIEKSGFVSVRYAGTGFLMIRRAALERMCAHYPRLQYKRDHSIDAATASDNRFALFECMIAEDGTYLSEDFAFCKRWIDIGGEIWADLASKLDHVGPMTFCGDLSSQFAAARVLSSTAGAGG